MGIELRPFIDQGGQTGPGKVGGYRRPEEVEFDDGTTLARYMPSSVGDKRMRGVVIPHAKPMGGSRAYDPHKPPHRRIHVDPHIEGQSVIVDLERVTQDIAEEAIQLGQEFADKHADEVHGVDQIRLRSSAAFHLIGASQRAHGDVPPAPNEGGRVITIPQGVAPEPAPAVAVGPRAVKAASFNGGPPRPPAQAQAQAPPMPVQPAPAAAPRGGLLDAYRQPHTHPAEPTAAASPTTVGPPPVKVTFGVPGFGLHEAYYHDVIVEKQCFTLVYDERYKGGNKYWPQIDGQFAARVDGDPTDYQLIWPDQMFHDRTTCRTYVTLYIDKRVPQEEES
jgi:hypothetical protein